MTKSEITKKIAKSGWASLTSKEKDYYYSATEELAEYSKSSPQGVNEIIYNEALRCLGRDISPKENEFACAESVNSVVMFALGTPVGGGTSTALMYQALQNKKRFKKVDEPLRGDIVISPTGYSRFRKPPFRNGHVGIVSDSDKIMSNDSATSLWKQNYTLTTWKARYQTKGGYPMDFFRVLN